MGAKKEFEKYCKKQFGVEFEKKGLFHKSGYKISDGSEGLSLSFSRKSRRRRKAKKEILKILNPVDLVYVHEDGSESEGQRFNKEGDETGWYTRSDGGKKYLKDFTKEEFISLIEHLKTEDAKAKAKAKAKSHFDDDEEE